MPTVAEIVAVLDAFAPPEIAAEWDNVGLLLGDTSASVERLLTCLTITPAVVAEAISNNVQLIVTHHPILFRGTKRITTSNIETRMVWDLARAGIAVYSPHTSFDNCKDGINDRLASRLQLTDVKPLRVGDGSDQCKVVVFVPESDWSKVADAMFAAGAGRIGDYRDCSFRLAGTGTFFGEDSTNPTLGQKGRREEVAEWRLEVVCPKSALNSVIAAMKKVHSYEEPAFDIYPLQTISRNGEGRIGIFPHAIPLSGFAAQVRAALKCGPVQVIGPQDRSISTVALACGAAGEFLSDAAKVKADVFLTGEMRFHDLLAAEAKQIAVVLPGHYATERFAIEELPEVVRKSFPPLKCWASKSEVDPIRFA